MEGDPFDQGITSGPSKPFFAITSSPFFARTSLLDEAQETEKEVQAHRRHPLTGTRKRRY